MNFEHPHPPSARHEVETNPSISPTTEFESSARHRYFSSKPLCSDREIARSNPMELNLDKKSYPLTPTEYKLIDEIGQGVSATVYEAKCLPFDEIVAIKSLDLERVNANLDDIRREAQTMSLINHANVLRAHCSFIVGQNLWVVMPYMAGGSCQSIMKTAFPNGFEEPIIGLVLKDTLKALEYLHQQGHIHRDVKAGNILIDSRGGVKVADFGVSACMFESGDRQRLKRNTFVGTPCWMAPEVIDHGNGYGYDYKADIWSFGITALELAHGHAPFSKFPPMKALLMQLKGAPPGLDYATDKKFSRSFREMVGLCLVKDPARRPCAAKLLKHSFFKHTKSPEYIVKHVLDSLPSLIERFKMIKAKETVRMKVCEEQDDDDDVIPHVRMRRISGWNFNENNLKFEPLYPLDEKCCHVMGDGTHGQKIVQTDHKNGEIVSTDTNFEFVNNSAPEPKSMDANSHMDIEPNCRSESPNIGENLNIKTHAGFLPNSRSELKRNGSNTNLCSGDRPAVDIVQGVQAHDEDSNSNSSPGSHDGGSARLKRSSDSELVNEDIKEICESMQCTQLVHTEKQHPREISDKKEGAQLAVSSEKHHPREISDKQEGGHYEFFLEKLHLKEISNKKEGTRLEGSLEKQHSVGDLINKPSNGSEHNSRGQAGHGPKPAVVQKKGRFSVTEEDVGQANKTIVHHPPPLRRMHSFSSHTSLSSISSSSSLCSPTPQCAPPNLPVNEYNSLSVPVSALVPHLQSLLQSNIMQQDIMLNLLNMGAVDPINSTHNSGLNVRQKSVSERESDLEKQVNDLQRRLSILQDELHVIKAKNAQLEHQLNAIYNKEEEERIRMEGVERSVVE
eukprot:Gb_20050 [translate_table: standard]